MTRRTILNCYLLIISFLLSCSSYKPVVKTSVATSLLAEDYISSYKDIAVNEMKRTGVPASITLAQGMLESDFGRSRLAVAGNNHFGIKCHNGWTGATIREKDETDDECFRKYGKAEESYIDHSDFLRSGSRYNFLFDLDPADYKAWAHGLKKAGYATNPDYANLLIRRIEENNLWNFDSGFIPGTYKANGVSRRTASVTTAEERPAVVFSNSIVVTERVQRIMENNGLKYIVVKDGETREKIEKEFGLLRWELPKYNDLDHDFVPSAGQVLYLQAKKGKAEKGKEYHNTASGETMHFISQLYGIKLKALYEINRMAKGSEPEAGTKIWLCDVRPAR